MNCSHCSGTGADAKKTAVMRKRENDPIAYVRCWHCNGDGLEPPYPYENWKEEKCCIVTTQKM